MSAFPSQVKRLAFPWPRVSAVLRWVYHTIAFRPIAKRRLKMYEEQLRLHRYFEEIYARELDYLRGHAKSLEIRLVEHGEGLSDQRLFPEIASAGNAFPVCPNNSHRKRYSAKNRWGGVDAEQAYFLETESLRRLALLKQERGDKNSSPFPKLLSASNEDLSITISDCGISLDALAIGEVPAQIPDHKAQVDYIVDCLLEAGVLHLDLRPDGKNLCVDEQGRLSLIDFDIVALDGTQPHSYQIKRRLDMARRFPGGYREWARSRLLRTLGRFDDRIELV